MHREKFYKSELFPYLRLKLTHGYQGNVNNSLSPYTLIAYNSGAGSIINQQYASISSPANPELSWETINQTNFGIDYRIGSRISGSVEYYRKKSRNLLWDAPADLTTGISSVKSNNASMIGKGIELSISSINIRGAFQWNTEFGYSYIKNEVTNYDAADLLDKARTVSGLVSSSLIITGVRKSAPYSLFSYRFAGLDPVTGDPLGYIGKGTSSSYLDIFNQIYSDTAGVIYHGSAIPTSFGYLNNVFRYKGFSLLININYRLGYYVRKNTISYYDLINSGSTHPDYAKRWQKPGDEELTNVPSLVYPLSDSRRDEFFAKSSVNVFKGDNVRLQNIRLAYDFTNKLKRSFPVKGFQVYANLENIGLIWRANDEGLDPDYTASSLFPAPKIFTGGLKIDF